MSSVSTLPAQSEVNAVTLSEDVMNVASKAEPSEEEVEAFSGKVFGAILGAQAAQAAYIGHELGWYKALTDYGPLTSTELAEKTQSSERYAREWLEWQTMTGWITCTDVKASAKERAYALPPAAQLVLVNKDSMAYLTPLLCLPTALTTHIDQLVKAYKSDEGVNLQDYPNCLRLEAESTRAFYLNALAPELVRTVPNLSRLSDGGTVIDLGAGVGYSSIGIAKHFPNVTVEAFDVDQTMVADAEAQVKEHGVADRVTINCRDAVDVETSQLADLVMSFLCIHELPDPIGFLRRMRTLAGPKGVVVIGDPGGPDEFTGIPNHPAECVVYGFSCTFCLPQSKVTQPSMASGSVLRAPLVKMLAQQAGFNDIRALSIAHPAFRFYELLQ